VQCFTSSRRIVRSGAAASNHAHGVLLIFAVSRGPPPLPTLNLNLNLNLNPNTPCVRRLCFQLPSSAPLVEWLVKVIPLSAPVVVVHTCVICPSPVPLAGTSQPPFLIVDIAFCVPLSLS
jgi:hypothetical protein